MPSQPPRRGWMVGSRVLLATLALLTGTSREIAAQAGRRSSSQLMSGTRLDATTTAPLCIGASAPPDTIPVHLTPAAFSEAQPAHWPSELTARIVRQRPDGIRHGV